MLGENELLWLLVIVLVAGFLTEVLASWGLLKRVEKLEEQVREFEKIENRLEATERHLSI